ncbi:Activating signal cointegrator 1 complex subunit 1 [Aphelenchoides bicaudatus]|nr:Activating signal cointegrator 1 complex subunit 1 [Aphelenchoides bicaudatus]
MSKQIEKYRIGYAIYRRNVALNKVVYGEKDGRVQHMVEEDEARAEESCAVGEDNFNDIDEPNRKTYKVTYNSKNNFWSASTLVPKSLMGRFLGAQGSNKKKIEQATGCEIIVPDRSKKHAPITIRSSGNAEMVERCLDQIEMFVTDQRRQAKPTHFVSLALQSNELVENHNTFCTLIKNSTAISEENKQRELFMPTVRLHLTLCMLALLTDSDKEKVKKALNEVVESEVRPMLKGEPLTVNVKGLDYFGDKDASETRVLYGKVSGIQLLDISSIVVKKMLSIGLAKREKRDLTLHMTIMNSKYAKRAARNFTFDANYILRDFSNYDFGSVKVDEVKICALNVDSNTGDYVTTHRSKFNVPV